MYFRQVDLRKSKRRSTPKVFFDDTPKNVKKATSKVSKTKVEPAKAKSTNTSSKYKKGQKTKGSHA